MPDGRARRRPGGLARWFRHLPTRAKSGVALLCVVALGGVVFGGYSLERYVEHRIDACARHGATDVVHAGPARECVGITDGSYRFIPGNSALNQVEADVGRLNHTVVTGHPDDYVSVVMLLPLSPNASSVMLPQDAIDQLRGAYAAQVFANTDHPVDSSPYIQMLLASNGYQAGQYETTDTIIERDAARRHIVAVDGLGVSLTQTQSAARDLTAAGLPVIGGTVTSDGFDDIAHMVRVASSNADEASAAVAWARRNFAHALLVADTSTSDTYDATLATGFAKFDSKQRITTQTYDSTARDRSGSPSAEQHVVDQLTPLPGTLCDAQADGPTVVLFAGRGRDLATLIGDMSGDGFACSKHITIVSGDDVTNMPHTQGVAAALGSGRVSLYYVGLASPDEWTTAKPDGRSGEGQAIAAGKAGFATFADFFTRSFHGTVRPNGNSMMGYDTVLTSVYAVRIVVAVSKARQQPSAATVVGELARLNNEFTVPGASGPLSFTTNGPDGSNPVGKPIPVLSYRPDGQSRFVEFDWPAGEPVAF